MFFTPTFNNSKSRASTSVYFLLPISLFAYCQLPIAYCLLIYSAIISFATATISSAFGLLK